MNTFDYQPSTADVEAMLACLMVTSAVLPSATIEDFEEEEKFLTLKYASSAIDRLSKMENKISFNELLSIYNSLVIADMINNQEISVDELSSSICSKYSFVIEKLIAVFENYFDD